MAKVVKEDDAEAIGSQHPWAANIARFAVDALLRSKGFEIFARKGRQEAVWLRRYLDVDGKPRSYFKDRHGEPFRYPQSDALMECLMLEVDAAQLQHEKYLDGRYW